MAWLPQKKPFCGFQNQIVVAKPPKNTISGEENHQTCKQKQFLWGTQWLTQWGHPKVHFDRYLRGFWGGVTAPPLALFSFI